LHPESTQSVDSGGTLLQRAEALLAAGALSASAISPHGVLSGAARGQRIRKSQNLQELVVTDTIQRPPRSPAPAQYQGKFPIGPLIARPSPAPAKGSRACPSACHY